ncbi:MAG: serine--tRNA ligase [Patescibacteria group bacterium]|nr:serine--tRNA ligase [Patescibacteria group bacterium]
MLDIKYIELHKKEVKKNCELRNIQCDVKRLLELNEKRKRLLRNVENLNAQKNSLNDEIKSVPASQKPDIIERGKIVKEQLSEKEPELKRIKEEFRKLLAQVPNVTHPDSPVGKDESENQVIRKNGEPTKFDFEPKDHMNLGEALDIIDTKTAAQVSGSRFNYIKGEAVLLQFAIIQFTFDVLTNEKIITELAKKVGNSSGKPFTPIIPPMIVKADVMEKMDRFEPIEDRYYFKEDDALLVGSAEHSLGPMFMNTTIDEKELPLRFVGYSTAFRREAGTYGKDTHGIFRCHQFDKLELEIFSVPEKGESEQDLIVAIQEYLIEKLKIPYQVVAICTGDMGKPDYRQIDIECWLAGQNKYRETHTSDYMTDFQARRLNTKVKRTDSSVELVHMNDATAFAIGRILIAIIENYQQKDGSVLIPEALQKYMPGGIKKIERGE